MSHRGLGRKTRRQVAVLWEATGYNNNEGEPLVSSPEEIMVRWEWTYRLSGLSQVREDTYDVIVDMPRRVRTGSKMWLGKLKDWLSTGVNQEVNDLMEVSVMTSSSGLRPNTGERHEAGLRRYRKALPV